MLNNKIISSLVLFAYLLVFFLFGATSGASIGLIQINWDIWDTSSKNLPNWWELSSYCLLGGVVSIPLGIVSWLASEIKTLRGLFPYRGGSCAFLNQDEEFWKMFLSISWGVLSLSWVPVGFIEGFAQSNSGVLEGIFFGLGGAITFGIIYSGFYMGLAAIFCFLPLFFLACFICFPILALGCRYGGFLGVALSGWVSGGIFVFCGGAVIDNFVNIFDLPEELPVTSNFLSGLQIDWLLAGLFSDFVGWVSLGVFGASLAGMIAVFTYDDFFYLR